MALKDCNNIEIPVLDHLSKDEFNSTYFKEGKPVIIRNSIEDWPAKEWDLDVLKNKLKSTPIYVRANTNCLQYKLGQQYNIRQTTFEEYINDIKKNNKRAQSSYMAVQNIKKALPQLEEDIRIPEYVGKIHGGPFLWIANKNHYEYNHYDPDDGFLIIVKGEKRVRLFSCAHLFDLYPNQLGTKGRTVQSRVNFENGEIDEGFPRFKKVACHYGCLTDGDMLYIPAFWFHQVTTLVTTISINIFWGNAGVNSYTDKVMKSPTWDCFRYWLLNIIQQNRNQVSFSRIISHLHQSLPNFLMTQWHEKLTRHQVNVLLKVVHRYLAATNDHRIGDLCEGDTNSNGGGVGGEGEGGINSCNGDKYNGSGRDLNVGDSKELNGGGGCGAYLNGSTGDEKKLIGDNEVCINTNCTEEKVFKANVNDSKACAYENTNINGKKVVSMHKDDGCVKINAAAGDGDDRSRVHKSDEIAREEEKNGVDEFDAEKFLRLLDKEEKEGVNSFENEGEKESLKTGNAPVLKIRGLLWRN